jgi:iron complex outermembrane receptor protein
MPTDSSGTFTFNLSGTYFSEYETAITAAAPMINKLNKIFNPLRFKARASLAWDMGPVRTQLTLNRVGGYINTNVTPNESVGVYMPMDLAVSWNIGDPGARSFFGGGFTLGAEVRNVFGEAPPYVNLAPNGNGSGGYDATVANPIGREISVSLRKKW